MKLNIFPTTVAVALLSTIAVLPEVVQAQSAAPFQVAQQTGTPQIDDFSVNSVKQLSPGTELVFTLQGTPNAKATLTIGSTVRNLPMQEVQPGIYEGRYTIRSQDSLSNSTTVRANLAMDSRVSSIRLQQPLVSTTATNPTSGSSTGQTVAIESFTAQPVQQLDPGTELTFTLVGTPSAKATFSIEGVTNNQALNEVSPGTYQGRYVIRRQDVFPTSNASVTARLQLGQESVRAKLDSTLTANNGSDTSTSQLPLEIISPQNNSRVQGSVELKGRSAPGATVNVSVQAVTSVVGIVGLNRSIFNQDVQTDAQGNFSVSFKPTLAVPGTQYEVSLKASKGAQTNEGRLVLKQQ
ncbi:MAG: hypothetical protein KME45_00275 [Stenomitos rutilans HA7619-LM2]|nr:hypothetical protein [Stenomitos rutilans HA7619-LM2]